jgi:glutathione synthase/RimK-type ligase-like ATP-grasp enzyme
VPHASEEGTVSTVALATCREFPLLDDEDRLVIPALQARGIAGVPAVWDDPEVDWASFDAVVVRETWDYTEDLAAYLAWTRRVDAASRLLNPPDVIAWNTDKRYLRDLAAAGLPVVPTVFVEPGDDPRGWRPAVGHADLVVKPAVSCGSRDTVRHAADGPLEPAYDQVAQLVAGGRTVMVQPYLEAVDTVGETALLFMGGQFSHAIRKGPLLVRGVEGERVGGLFVQEQIDPREPTVDEMAVALRVLQHVPGGPERVLYARVDLIPGPDGEPLLLELELTEPSLFLSHAEGAADRLAQAIETVLGPAR